CATPRCIPVAAGGRRRLTAAYDDSLPHTRVMGIMLVYLAPAPVSGCPSRPSLPADPASHPGAPPRVVLPLLHRPTGPIRNVFSTWMGDFAYGAPRVEMQRAWSFRWPFQGPRRPGGTL